MLIRALYTLLLCLASPVLLFGLYKKKPGKPTFGSRWKEHFGFTPPVRGQRPIWVHAVSVGESIAAIPVIKALKAAYPDTPIVVTTTTSTGAQQVEKLGDLVEHRYMPIDFAWCVRGFLRAVRPSAMLIMETELWPNTLATVHSAGIPVIVMNARLSARSATRYQRFQPVFKLIARHLDHILCLHQDDADRFARLGIAASRLTVTGSVKFDIHIDESIRKQAQQLRTVLGSARPVWVAASTHKGEDEQVLEAFAAVRHQHPDSLLILVPRHPERFDQVEQLCLAQSLRCVRRTGDQAVTPETQVYLADTMGEMLLFLGAADITFMGGSLIGDRVGGHNMLEPAAMGKPTLTGPSFYNFADITQQLRDAGALEVCQDARDLGERLSVLLAAPEQRQCMSQAALNVVRQNQGAVNKTLTVLATLLKD
ncbi:3-deoxy-D-manno-octulosonic acid transferase [Photobacterium ganghwense]|uniref:3-deoxy-D-manno-octulosonic acid transferase n=1 Tax=Photobacterium ganghwense TaxID=320778 RepID=A0A0J1H1L3_9GAMM|nr:lipid IV(A) 3-deoxy-D-manno-octulosonic acid transferase [Photobacterium ganghwense]KLV05699.1 3-deoxy-D-manno-octulosonic acid transferase [Photobacterium ganghwense]PSU06234.1 3-deoxy-D-manno-octulosonic acid transferase [Photobacterium ganghwense]QSV14238.1 lipid IV(A) 3-deoxy-D-manno-octulosonic acid transferase [Photobacterium ganghwense]